MMETNPIQASAEEEGFPRAETDPVDWRKVLEEIDFLSVKILDHIYFKDQLTLHRLAGSLECRVAKGTIRNRLETLSGWGLVEIVDGSNPLCVMKELRLEKKVKKLIVLAYGKFEVKRR